MASDVTMPTSFTVNINSCCCDTPPVLLTLLQALARCGRPAAPAAVVQPLLLRSLHKQAQRVCVNACVCVGGAGFRGGPHPGSFHSAPCTKGAE